MFLSLFIDFSFYLSCSDCVVVLSIDEGLLEVAKVFTESFKLFGRFNFLENDLVLFVG